MDELTARPSRSRALGDITAAMILTIGAAIERTRASRTHGHRAWLAAVPIAGVNAVAFLGQLKYWHVYLPYPPEQVLVAIVLEAVAVYWAWQAHRARMADDSSLRLQLAAYLTAAGVGVMNYTHFMLPGWHPTVAAVTFGGASALSPWLWGSHSRRENRDDLKARNLIEDHGVRLGITRWFWHAWRCVRVTWQATWIGENRPAEAIRLIGKPAVPQPDPGDAIYEIVAELIDKVAELGDRIAQTPPSAPHPVREPRQVRAGRAARAPGLTAVPAARLAGLSAAEQSVVLDLLSAEKLPGRDKLAREDARLGGNRRSAWRVLEAVRAGRNGGGHGVDDGS